MNENSTLVYDENINNLEFYYCEKENKTIKNLTQFYKKDFLLKNNRFYLEENKLFTLFRSDEEYINEKLCGKNLILINTGGFGRLQALRSIFKIKNFFILCLTIPEFGWAESFVDNIIYCNVQDDSDDNFYKILKIINEYSFNNNRKFDGIITYDDFSVILCSRLASALNLIGLDYDTALNIKDKYLFRKLLKKNKLFDDAYFYLMNKITIQKISNDELNVDGLNFSENKTYILKETFGAGKNFVRKFQNLEKLKFIIKEIENKENLNNKQYIIEEFFEGVEIDIDLIVQNSKIKFISISDNIPTDQEYFFERGGCTPSKYLDREEIEFIKIITQKIVNILKIDNSCLHFEAKCQPKSIYGKYEKNMPFYPIEINLRLGGAEVFSFNISSYNYNLFYNQIQIALGIELEEYESDTEIKKFSSSINFQSTGSGYVKEISFDKDFFEKEGLVNLSLFSKVGGYIDLEQNAGNSYLGWMVVSSKNSIEDSVNNLNRIINKIKFVIEK